MVFSSLTISLVVSVLVHIVFTLPIDSNLVDLSYGINENTLHWITHRAPRIRVTANKTIEKGGHNVWYQAEELELSTHTGTHLDAPCHFSKGKWCVSDIPIENLVDRPAIVLDITKESEVNRDYEVNIDDIQRWEEEHGLIAADSVLFIKTGWGKYWPNKQEYFGTETQDLNLLHFPGISPELAEWLGNERKIVGLGIEGPSIDSGQRKDSLAHANLFNKNIYALENVAHDLYKLPPTGATVTILPMKLDNGSGSPARIVANLSGSSVNSAYSMATVSVKLLSTLLLLYTTTL